MRRRARRERDRRLMPPVNNADVERQLRALHGQGKFEEVAVIALRTYQAEVLRWLRNSVRDEVAAQEIWSICLENFWKILPAFRFEASIRNLLYRLARFATYGYFRGRQREQLAPESLLDSHAAPDLAETDERFTTEIRNELKQLCEGLTIKQRMILMLKVEQEMSWDDIARIMSKPGELLMGEAFRREVVNLRQQFSRLKQELARRLLRRSVRAREVKRMRGQSARALE
jgi:RNA polymerase sigma-70 factor, ECF subfamily